MVLSTRHHIWELACSCACVGFKGSGEQHIVACWCRVNLFVWEIGFTWERREYIFSSSVQDTVCDKRKLVKRWRRSSSRSAFVSERQKHVFLNLLQNRFFYRLKLDHPWRVTTVFLGNNSSNRSCLGLAGFYWWKCWISAQFFAVATPSLGCAAVKGRLFSILVPNSLNKLVINTWLHATNMIS